MALRRKNMGPGVDDSLICVTGRIVETTANRVRQRLSPSRYRAPA